MTPTQLFGRLIFRMNCALQQMRERKSRTNFFYVCSANSKANVSTMQIFFQKTFLIILIYIEFPFFSGL